MEIQKKCSTVESTDRKTAINTTNKMETTKIKRMVGFRREFIRKKVYLMSN